MSWFCTGAGCIPKNMLKNNTRRFNRGPPNASIWNRSSANTNAKAKANANANAKAKAKANISRNINKAARNRRLATMRLPTPSYPMVVRQRMIPTKPALSEPERVFRYQLNKQFRNTRRKPTPRIQNTNLGEGPISNANINALEKELMGNNY